MAINGKYIYNIAFRAIDYCGDVENNRGYSDYFSPNNIKRLIISPDAVMSEFYISVPNVGKSKIVRLPVQMMSSVEVFEDYTPIIQIISTDRICSSIEEIIFATQSVTGQFTLSSREYDLESMVTSFTNRQGDLLETIKKRYVRLKDIVVFNGTFDQYRSIMSEVQVKADTLISNVDGVKAMSTITTIHDEPNWFEKWGSAAAAKTYPLMDGVDGKLWTYFEHYKAAVREKIKKNEVEDFKKDLYGSLESEVKDKFDKFKRLAKMNTKIDRLVKTLGFDGDHDEILRDVISPTPNEKLYKCKAVESYPLLVEAESGVSEKAILEFNRDTIDRAVAQMCYNLSKSFYQVLSFYSDAYPLVLAVMLHDCETSIIPYDKPEKYKFMELLEESYHYVPDGKKLTTSCINVCWVIAERFLKRSEEYKSEYGTREYWADMLRG